MPRHILSTLRMKMHGGSVVVEVEGEKKFRGWMLCMEVCIGSVVVEVEEEKKLEVDIKSSSNDAPYFIWARSICFGEDRYDSIDLFW